MVAIERNYTGKENEYGLRKIGVLNNLFEQALDAYVDINTTLYLYGGSGSDDLHTSREDMERLYREKTDEFRLEYEHRKDKLRFIEMMSKISKEMNGLVNSSFHILATAYIHNFDLKNF